MDFYFKKYKKTEREFQQLVARENTLSGISNKTDYFIADIELQISGAHFDMLAFKWIADTVIRKNGNVQLSLIEMKYGDDAFGDGTRGDDSGIVDHYKQMQKFLTKQSSELVEMAENQINQLNKLELIKHTRGVDREFIVNKERLEIVFLFANHKPMAPRLIRELNLLKSQLTNVTKEIIDLRFFVASSSGYALYDACMMDIEKYMAFLESRNLS